MAALKVLTTTIPDVIKAGTPASLSNNGPEEIRLYHARDFRHLADLRGATITFHTDDEKTEVEIRAYMQADRDDRNPRYKHVILTLG